MIRSPSRVLSVLLALALPATALAECKLAELLKIPVTLNGEKPLVPAKVNGSDTHFLLDSGAWISTISRTEANRLKLEKSPLPFDFNLKGIGGVTDDAEWTTVNELTLGGSRIHDVGFVVTDDLFGQRAAGLLGQNLLAGFDIDYDLANGVIRLMYADKGCRDSSLAYWAGEKPYSVIDLSGVQEGSADIDSARVRRRAAGHTKAIVKVNGKRIRALFDTGADLSIIDTEAARGAGVTRDSPGVKAAGYGRGMGRGRVETWIAPFDSFEIGAERITHTHLRVGDLRQLDSDMLVGADFFLSHRVYVSNLQHKLYFTYNGSGPVFDLSQAREAAAGAGSGSGPEPADAEGYSGRGMASAARGNLDSAIADLTKACELAPAESKYLALRAELRWRAGDGQAAKADYDRALDLKPDWPDVRLKRAELLIGLKQVDAAVADLDVAAGAVAVDSADTLRIARLYSRAGRFDSAVTQYSRWIAAKPEERLLPTALNGRCRTRALSGRELAAALDDCNKALALTHDAEEVHDSRGLVELRLGRYDEAIEDYGAALKVQPDMAWARYGRGLAKLKKGQASEGQADIDAARAADPNIVEEAARYGIGP